MYVYKLCSVWYEYVYVHMSCVMCILCYGYCEIMSCVLCANPPDLDTIKIIIEWFVNKSCCNFVCKNIARSCTCLIASSWLWLFCSDQVYVSRGVVNMHAPSKRAFVEKPSPLPLVLVVMQLIFAIIFLQFLTFFCFLLLSFAYKTNCLWLLFHASENFPGVQIWKCSHWSEYCLQSQPWS